MAQGRGTDRVLPASHQAAYPLWPADLPGQRLRHLWATTQMIVVLCAIWNLWRVSAVWQNSTVASRALLLGLLAAAIILSRRRTTLAMGLVTLWAAVLFAALGNFTPVVSGHLFLTCLLVVATSLRTRPAVIAMVTLSVTYLGARALVGFPIGLHALDGIVMAVLASAALTSGLGALIDETARADDLNEVTSLAEVRTALGEAHDDSIRDVRRLIHDEAIPVLMAAADDTGGSVGSIRALAATAIGRIRHLGEVTAGGLLLQEAMTNLAADSPIDTIVRPPRDGASATVVLDGPTRVAVERATAETLRNAARHSDATQALITWTTTPTQTVLQISDDGHGFPADPVVGFGMESSIREPISSVGGSVEFAGGEGAQVVLRWPRVTRRETPLVRTWTATMASLSGTSGILARVVIPLVISQAYLAVAYAAQARQPWAHLALALWVTLFALLVLRRVTQRAATPGLLIGIALGAAATNALGLALAGTGGLANYSSWVIGFVTIVVAIPCFVTDARWTFVVVGPSILVVLADSELTGFGLARAVDPLSAAVLTPVLFFLWGVRLRRDSADREADLERLRLLTLAAEGERRRSLASNSSWAALQGDVIPLLSTIADSPTSSLDPDVRAQARLIALGLRDELRLGGHLDAHLRQRLRAARAAGVTIRLLGEPTTATALTGIRIVDRLLDLDPAPATLVVQFADATTDKVIATLVPPLAPSQQAQLTVLLRGYAARFNTGGFATTVSVNLGRSPEGIGAAPSRRLSS